MSRGFAAETSPPRRFMNGPIIVGTILALEVFSCRIGTGAGLPDMVRCPLTALHGRLYVRATLQGQAQPNWWLVDTGSPWSLVNADQVRGLTQSNPAIGGQVATKDGRILQGRPVTSHQSLLTLSVAVPFLSFLPVPRLDGAVPRPIVFRVVRPGQTFL
jgi:hypothetical protein